MDREASIAFATKYLEDILAFFGLNVAVGVRCSDDVIELSVPSTHLNGFLIGQHGATLKSIQMLIAAALRNKEASLQRVTVDIANYKRHLAEKLEEQARQWCQQVVDSGEAMHLEPMNPADRRVVHQVVGEYPALSSESEGEGKGRHIVIMPAQKAED